VRARARRVAARAWGGARHGRVRACARKRARYASVARECAGARAAGAVPCLAPTVKYKCMANRCLLAMCELNPECDGALYYDTCQSCGARKEEQCSMRTNVHLPSRAEVRRRKDKLARMGGK